MRPYLAILIVCAVAAHIPYAAGANADADAPARPSAEKTDETADRSTTLDADAGARRNTVIPISRPDVEYVAKLLDRVWCNQTPVPSPRPGVVVDEGTQSLIVTATADELALIRAILSQIDRRSRPAAGPEDRGFALFRLAVYELTLSRQQAAEVRVDELVQNAGTPSALYAALGELGDAVMLYRLDQHVRLQRATGRGSSTSFTIGANVPFVRGTSVSDAGRVQNQINYENVGCRVELAGEWSAPGRGYARMELELSSLTQSTVELGQDVRAPVFQDLDQQYEGPIEAGRPVVLLSVNGTGDEPTATAYVTRIEFEVPR